ncbi:MAG: hypothetical protein FJ146_05990, partial [Deltaproteobacteria bacterium]|nr:hypothetical protein [Deltaproteobacteria bacterium]
MTGLRRKTVACFVMRLGVCWTVATAFSIPASAQSLGSLPMTYSGRLTETSGAPKDGAVDMVATFWTAEFDGTQLGQSFSFTSIILNQGVFSIYFPFMASQVQDIFRDGTEPVF